MNSEQLINIYENEITRNINPAVAANKMDAETITIEIKEYVFSDDIINSLYRVLNTIKGNGLTDKKGIWINGYYGSGKSHFLKYVHYCMNPDTSERAFNHLYNELDKKDIFDPNTHLECAKTDFTVLQRWFSKANIDDILFNVQTFSDTENKGRGTFTNVFFNMFNKSRGLNGSNIRLAVLLENKLKEGGNFENFKKKIKEESFDWDSDYSMLTHTELETVLNVAKECDQSIDTDSLKNAFLDKEAFQVTIDVFTKELKKYLDKFGDNARIVFLVDEVSQFINNNKDVLLDLQDLVEHTSNTCGDKVIIACTAQQTMDEMADGTGVSSINKLDEVGKIMGRFETRVSLQSTDPSYITKKRILAKKGIYEDELGKLYDDNKDAIQSQFFTDNQQYKEYQDKEDFTATYPFVPYQFELISKVFEGFQSKDYVQKEVKDNERSILKITHVTAQYEKDKYIGYFVPFDAFYNKMMEQNFIHKGHRAIEPALKLKWKDDTQKAFALRVIHVLFMISNLSEQNRQQLEPTIDNLTWLLIDSLDNNRKELREKITEITEVLQKENIIREEKGSFYFYNEDEAELSSIIKNTVSRDMEYELDTFNKEILSKVLTKISSKYNAALRSFSIQVSIDGKTIVNVANPDLKVVFTLFDSTSISNLSLNNDKKCMVVCIHEILNENAKIRDEYRNYCRVMNYIRVNQNVSNKVREKSIENFRERYRNLMTNILLPKFTDFINHAPVITGPNIIDNSVLSGKTGNDRYETALKELIELNYNKLNLIKKYPHTTDELNKYLDKANEFKNTELDVLSDAEKVADEIIKIRAIPISLADLVNILDKAPYGWPVTSILGVLIDLNKHKLRSFNYKHEKRYLLKNFINKAQSKKEFQSLEIVSMQRISQEVIVKLGKDWQTIFNEPLVSVKDGDALFNEISGPLLAEQIEKFQEGRNRAGKYVFVKAFDCLIDEIQKIKIISDPEVMYLKISDKAEELALKVNQCNSLLGMMDNTRFMQEYNSIINFVKTRKEEINDLEGDYSNQLQILDNLLTDENPVNSLKTASKVYKELQKALTDAVSNMKSSLINKYTAMYDYIDGVAETNNVSKEAYKPLTGYINKIENCNKVGQLKIFEISLEKEKGDLRTCILNIAAQRTSNPVQPKPETEHNPEPGTNDNSGNKHDGVPENNSEIKNEKVVTTTPAEKTPATKYYTIKKPDKIIKTTDDVDKYVGKIREDLKKLIDDDNIVIVN